MSERNFISYKIDTYIHSSCKTIHKIGINQFAGRPIFTVIIKDSKNILGEI